MTGDFLEQAKSGDRRSLARTLSALENGSLDIKEVLSILGPVPPSSEESWQTLAITGAPGVGKTTLAKVLFAELDVSSYDILEINASRENSVAVSYTHLTLPTKA